MGVLDSLIEKHGGDLNRLVSKFEQAGLGNKIKSWIGTGDNESVSPQEVKQALGPDEVQQVAQEAGVEPEEAAEALAKDLPGAVDKATPGGTIPGVDEVKKRISGMFGR